MLAGSKKRDQMLDLRIGKVLLILHKSSIAFKF